MLSMPALLRLLVHRRPNKDEASSSSPSRPQFNFPVKTARRKIEGRRLSRESLPAIVTRDTSPASSAGKTSPPHYVLRRSTVAFPQDMPPLRHHSSLQALNVHLTPTLPLPPSSPLARPKRVTSVMAHPPKRKPVPSLYALDPENAPLMIPLPPSPALETVELEDMELETIVV